MTSGEESETDAELMFADMPKPNKKKGPLEGRYLPTESTVCLSEVPTVPRDEWELYEQLACELEGAECFVQDLRHRLQTFEQQLARRIEDQDKSLERLVGALPVTKLLQ